MDLVTVSGALDHLLPQDLHQKDVTECVNSVFVQLKDSDGNEAGSPVWLPLSIDTTKLTNLVKEFLKKVRFKINTVRFINWLFALLLPAK